MLLCKIARASPTPAGVPIARPLCSCDIKKQIVPPVFIAAHRGRDSCATRPASRFLHPLPRFAVLAFPVPLRGMFKRMNKKIKNKSKFSGAPKQTRVYKTPLRSALVLIGLLSALLIAFFFFFFFF